MLSIIIISYNVKSYLRQCLKSIYNSKINIPFEIIIVDNDSFDHSAEMVESEFEKITLLKNNQNYGFSKAVNQGVKIAKGDFICLLNPDALVEIKTLDILYRHLQNNIDVGIVGAKVVNPDGSLQLASKRSFPTFLIGLSKLLGLDKLFPKSKLFGKYNKTFDNENKITVVDAVSGSCMMFRKKLFQQMEGFDESFFLYFEDTDFCTRVMDAGYKILFIPKAIIIHYKGESHKYAPFDTIKIFHKSMSLFFNKHSNKFKFWPISWLFIKLGIKIHLLNSYIKKNSLKLISLILDTMIILHSFLFSIYTWYYFNYSIEFNFLLLAKHLPLIICYLIVWYITATKLKIYSIRLTSYGRSFAVCLITFFITTVFVYYISIIAYSRGVLMLSSFICGIFIPAWRVIAILLYKNRYTKISQNSPLFTQSFAVIGTGKESQLIGELLINSPSIDYNLIGYIDFSLDKNNINNDIIIIGRKESLIEIIQRHNINEIIIPENIYSGNFLIDLFKSIKGLNVSVKYVSSNENILIGKGIATELGLIKLIDLDISIFESFNSKSKRVFDILFSIILIILSSPFQFFLYIIFPLNLKYIWGDRNTHLKLKYFNSSKSFIRNIPILYSILKGDISFVGCRQISIESIKPNLMFKPGLTGLGQIKSPNKKRDLSIFDEYYIQNQSFLFDLEILLKSMLKI
jgi:O-antigen biosynthesis protein